MGPFTGRVISPEHVDLFKNNNLMWEVGSVQQVSHAWARFFLEFILLKYDPKSETDGKRFLLFSGFQ